MQTILQMALKQIHKVNAAAHWAIPAEAFAQSALQPAGSDNVATVSF
jgi:hypothetical protein